MADAQISSRHIPDRLQGGGARLLKSWKRCSSWSAAVIFLGNSLASPYFLDPWNLSDATVQLHRKGDDRLRHGAGDHLRRDRASRVASIIRPCLDSHGLCGCNSGFGTPALVATGLGRRSPLRSRQRAPDHRPGSAVDRGDDRHHEPVSRPVLHRARRPGLYRLSESFAWFGQGYVWWVFSFEFTLFVVLAVIYAVCCTGRISAVPSMPSATTRRRHSFSVVRVGRVKFTLFLLTGLMAGLASVCLTSRLGSTRPSNRARLGAPEVVTIGGARGFNILGGLRHDTRGRGWRR